MASARLKCGGIFMVELGGSWGMEVRSGCAVAGSDGKTDYNPCRAAPAAVMQHRPHCTPMKLSVIIITKNEADNIQACLDSVSFADQRIIVDSGSTDGTVAIARAAGATVIEADWPGFGPQKNRVLDAATGEWVLSLDADER